MDRNITKINTKKYINDPTNDSLTSTLNNYSTTNYLQNNYIDNSTLTNTLLKYPTYSINVWLWVLY